MRIERDEEERPHYSANFADSYVKKDTASYARSFVDTLQSISWIIIAEACGITETACPSSLTVRS